MSKTKLMLGDNIESLKKLPDNSVDSIVSDPPYALNFMNKRWDSEVPSVEFWKEVYRVLKPGGHVLSFGGTRTYHRMVVNIEDAGFEIRDQIQWIYGSGFPKSHNIGKAVDKLQGNDREVVSTQESLWKPSTNTYQGDNRDKENLDNWSKKKFDYTKGSSPYEGWGTALKPANEPICVARKPLSEKSVAENVLKWRTGGINVDGCRVGTTDTYNYKNGPGGNSFSVGKEPDGKRIEPVEMNSEGRFPANIILECICDEVIKGEKGEAKKTTRDRKYDTGDTNPQFNSLNGKIEAIDNYNDKGDIHTNPMCPCYIMDQQSGTTTTKPDLNYKYDNTDCDGNTFQSRGKYTPRSDKGGASRFFYQAKVSKAERNMGLDGFEEKKKDFETTTRTNKETADKFGCERKGTAKNSHPTIKPVSLMSYLCRMVTPPGGICLDPFMGSGSTGIAARLEGFKFIGMEMSEEYFKIAEARIENYEQYRKFLK